MKKEYVSNVFAIVLSILTILSALSVFLGQMCTKLFTGGFIAYLLNIFSAPILMIVPVFVKIFGGLWVIYFIVAVLFVVGVLDLTFTLYEIKNGNKYAFRITRYVFSCLAILLFVFIFYSIIANGFSILNDSSVWSSFWLVLYLISIVISFVLRTILLAKNKK
ncbi:MAG: hypothetical protein IJ837_03620 [Clostridia bacterium]|nr:hypothetical protein [Clostridia bacterium]